MTLSEITSAITPIKSGTYTRISFKTAPPPKKESKDAGWSVIKITSITGRFAAYSNLKSVISRRASQPVTTPPKMWYHEIIPNRLAKHNNKDNYYLSFVKDDKSAKAKDVYIVLNNKTGEKKIISSDDEMKALDIIQNGYWRDYAANELKMIDIENVISVGQPKRRK